MSRVLYDSGERVQVVEQEKMPAGTSFWLSIGEMKLPVSRGTAQRVIDALTAALKAQREVAGASAGSFAGDPRLER